MTNRSSSHRWVYFFIQNGFAANASILSYFKGSWGRETPMLILGGLSGKEIDEICRQPRVLRGDLFGEADKWLKRNKMILEREYAGRYVLVNALNEGGGAGQSSEKVVCLFGKKTAPPPAGGPPPPGKKFLPP